MGHVVSRLRDAQLFAEMARNTNSLDELTDKVDSICREIGFRRFGFGHHFDHKLGITNAFFLHNYPSGWADQFIERSYYLKDPVVRVCREFNVPYRWADMPSLISVTSTEWDLMEAAMNEGVQDGFTIPISNPGEFDASFNFATPTRKSMTDADYFMGNMIGRVAFEAARRIRISETRGLQGRKPRLSERQRECLILAGQGKTDWEISRILGVSPETAKLHLKTARERYAVNKRVSLVIRALHDGDIDFSEVIH